MRTRWDHRVCEMHQDVYIFKKHMNLDVGLAEFLDSGVRACGRDGDPDRLDEDIARPLRVHVRDDALCPVR